MEQIKKGVKLIAPPIGSTDESKLSLSDFPISEKGQVLARTQGHAPAKVKKKKRNSVGFDLQHCQQGPNLSSCPFKKGRKLYSLLYHPHQLVKPFCFVLPYG